MCVGERGGDMCVWMYINTIYVRVHNAERQQRGSMCQSNVCGLRATAGLPRRHVGAVDVVPRHVGVRQVARATDAHDVLRPVRPIWAVRALGP